MFSLSWSATVSITAWYATSNLTASSASDDTLASLRRSAGCSSPRAVGWLAASWSEGDFGYDGIVDILDAADFVSTGLFNAGPYGPVAATGTIAAVPEPALPVALACAGLVSARCWIRIRRTSAIARG